MRIVILPEAFELPLQIIGIPEGRMVKEFSTNCAEALIDLDGNEFVRLLQCELRKRVDRLRGQSNCS